MDIDEETRQNRIKPTLASMIAKRYVEPVEIDPELLASFEPGLTQEEKDAKYFSKFDKKEYKVNVEDLPPLQNQILLVCLVQWKKKEKYWKKRKKRKKNYKEKQMHVK